MKEQPIFAPGDRVICVDSKGTAGLTEGNKYSIQAIRRCSCGIVEVNVGIRHDAFTQFCHRCRTVKKANSTLWYMQTRFVPVDFDRYAEETFHQSLKGKPVKS